MSDDFRLRISLWGSFVFVWVCFFNQGCCVFIQYNLLKGCYEWILIELWTQVIDYSLLGLTWHARLRISISHLSIFGKCCASPCFYFLLFLTFLIFCWLFMFLFFSDSSLSSQESILTFLLFFWLILKPYQFFNLIIYDSIIVYYITKLHYSRLLYLTLPWLLYNIVFSILFLFLFYFFISFTFILQMLFDLVLYLLFYLVFALLYLLSIYIIMYPA